VKYWRASLIISAFGGLNYDEVAEVLKIARVTVRRDWEFARAWLHTELHNVD
jgi:DNA-directed RNA polymerase specialized sigma24 family protein